MGQGGEGVWSLLLNLDPWLGRGGLWCGSRPGHQGMVGTCPHLCPLHGSDTAPRCDNQGGPRQCQVSSGVGWRSPAVGAWGKLQGSLGVSWRGQWSWQCGWLTELPCRSLRATKEAKLQAPQRGLGRPSLPACHLGPEFLPAGCRSSGEGVGTGCSRGEECLPVEAGLETCSFILNCPGQAVTEARLH